MSKINDIVHKFKHAGYDCIKNADIVEHIKHYRIYRETQECIGSLYIIFDHTELVPGASRAWSIKQFNKTQWEVVIDRLTRLGLRTSEEIESMMLAGFKNN